MLLCPVFNLLCLIVTVNAKARVVTVKGPRGTLRREFKHVDLQLEMISAHKMKVLLWHAGRKHAACLRTVASGIMNMIKGVTKVGALVVLACMARGADGTTGFRVQDAIRVRSLPYQRRDQQWRQGH